MQASSEASLLPSGEFTPSRWSRGTWDQQCSDLGAHLGGSSPEGTVLAVSQPLGRGNQQVSCAETSLTAPRVWDPSDRSQMGHSQCSV